MLFELLMMLNRLPAIGFSTGALYPLDPCSTLAARINLLDELQIEGNPCPPIELHVASRGQLDDKFFPGLLDSIFLAAKRLFFHEITLHAPHIQYPGPESEFVLGRLRQLCEIGNAKSVVFHPDAITDLTYIPHLQQIFGGIVAFENLDRLSHTARTPEELAPYLEFPGTRAVIDTSHVWSVEQNMPLQLMRAFLDRFGDSISHIHGSVCIEGDPHGQYHHDQSGSQLPLLQLAGRGLMIINEGVIPRGTVDPLAKLADELIYLRQHLSS